MYSGCIMVHEIPLTVPLCLEMTRAVHQLSVRNSEIIVAYSVSRFVKETRDIFLVRFPNTNRKPDNNNSANRIYEMYI